MRANSSEGFFGMDGYKERIPKELNPNHIDYLKAKSEDFGGDTLAEHTWAVLCRLHDQYRLRPHLAQQLEDERLWHRMYWGCFLHDFGKAAAQFQERLLTPKIENQWTKERHRHEILSLGFVEWLFPAGHQDRNAIIAIVAAHHKDFSELVEKYGVGQRHEVQEEFVNFLAGQVTQTVVNDLWTWLVDYGQRWQVALGFPVLEIELPAYQEVFDVKNIRNALDDFDTYLLMYQISSKRIPIREFLYRGLIFTSDHSASAGASAFPAMTLNSVIANKPLSDKNLTLNEHQKAASHAKKGSMLMIAPTGSGKTEAAILWAAQQLQEAPSSRLFYTLPYQASMNAMALRLAERFFGVSLADEIQNQQITIQHSRATLRYYELMRRADSGLNTSKATQKAKDIKNKARLNYYPIQVFSPYQMLKAAYQLKGYESLLVDFTNALFIFDEIHAYEPKRLALIIGMMGWLAREYHARFLVMTATLPPMIKEKIEKALNLTPDNLIVASPADFAASQRHIVHICDRELNSAIDSIVQNFREGQAVLVVCNQVARAQEIYNLLQNAPYNLHQQDLLLLHGRFNGRDRAEKEDSLAKYVGVGTKTRRPMIVVATQVVEVSLDVDFDVLYTDPAPLSALIQRFGRVNREKLHPTRPVYVFREPSDDKGVRPYAGNEVRKSLAVLEKYCNHQAIDEAQVTHMLTEIYQDEEILQAWQTAYKNTASLFEETLKTIKPYESADEATWRKFYSLFDGRQVLPADSAIEYGNEVKKSGFLGASGYLVNISEGQYQSMKQKGFVIGTGRDEYSFVEQVTVPYTSELGLDIMGALRQKDEEV
jgi:CRISPR-associated endonuclease/helicase Cas3